MPEWWMWGLGLGVYAYGIEPQWIQVTRHEVRAPVQAPLTIAHLTDLHTKRLAYRERKLLRLLDRLRPDVIVITGDTVANRGTHRHARALLQHLRAPLGVWAVRGNWEHYRAERDERSFFESLNIKFLSNGNAKLRDDVWVVGLDEECFGHPDEQLALAGVPPGVCVIALFHTPVSFPRVAGRCHVALSGHTHGGQIRLPFLPALVVPPASGPYREGWYQHRGSRMYVSRGLGTSGVPLRFFCRPELAFISLKG